MTKPREHLRSEPSFKVFVRKTPVATVRKPCRSDFADLPTRSASRGLAGPRGIRGAIGRRLCISVPHIRTVRCVVINHSTGWRI